MLEILAMTTMLIDHIGAIFFPSIIYFRIIGRIAFPIYCFLFVRGTYYTRNSGKYLLRLVFLALISQSLYLKLFNINRLNVIFTFAFCLVITKLINGKQYIPAISFVIITFFLLPVSFDYGLYAVFLILIYQYSKTAENVLFAHFLLNVFYLFKFGWLQMFSIFGSLVIVLYDKNALPEFKINRTAYRFFYPLHLCVLYLIKAYFFLA